MYALNFCSYLCQDALLVLPAYQSYGIKCQGKESCHKYFNENFNVFVKNSVILYTSNLLQPTDMYKIFLKWINAPGY